jgi:hypothetical protein
MKRVMIQVDESLLARARLGARESGVTFPQFVRTALEHELEPRFAPPPPMQGAGLISTGGEARRRAYVPDPWR